MREKSKFGAAVAKYVLRRDKKRRRRTRVRRQADSNRDDLSTLSIEITRFVRKDKPQRKRFEKTEKRGKKGDGSSYKMEVMK